MFTPIVDAEHESWEAPVAWTNFFTQYQAKAWAEYWRRGWVLVEVFLSCVKPTPGHEERSQHFRGILGRTLAHGRRPHLLHGSKEEAAGRPPLLLLPTVPSHFNEHKPSEAKVTKEEDRRIIAFLEAAARRHMRNIVLGYSGEKNASGLKHGHGTFRWENGDVYDGQWESNQMKGHGVFESASGSRYSGEWSHSVRHGFAKEVLADGGVYEGSYERNLRSGHGTYTDASGIYYEGQWQDLKHGWGKVYFTDGSTYEGEWAQDEMHGDGVYITKEGARHEGTFDTNRLIKRHPITMRSVDEVHSLPKQL